MAITRPLITIILFCYSWFFSSAQDVSTPVLVVSQYKLVVGDTLWYKIYLFDQGRNLVEGKNWIKVNLVDNDGISKYQSQAVVNEGIGMGQFQIPEMQPGNYRLVVYDLYFRGKESGISTQDIVIVSADILLKQDSMAMSESNSQNTSISLDKVQYRPREKVTIELNNPTVAEFSISVTNADLLGVSQRQSIYDEVSAIRNLEKEKSKTKPNTNRQIEGYAFHDNTNQPLPDSTTIFFYLQHSGWRFQTKTGKRGYVKIFIPDIQFNDEFFYLVEVDGVVTSKVNIQWKSGDIEIPASKDKKMVEGLDPYALYASKKRIIDRSFQFYSDNKNLPDAALGSPRAQIPATQTIRTEDYELFPTMAEYIKEVLPFIFVRERNGAKVLRIKMRPLSTNQPSPNTTNDPIYFIDGIATNNTNYFLSLKPSDINAITFSNDPRKLLPYGLLGKNGIIMVETKQKGHHEALRDKSKTLEALITPASFPKMNYEKNSQMNLPDFRPVLYWNPSIRTNETGKARIEFYTSDDLGSFQVEIIGFANKEPFWIKKYFEVKQ